MASFFSSAGKAGGKSTIDLPLAAFAALAVAFVVMAMPDYRFSQIVEATGLPSILSAAQPPLGLKARIAVGMVGGIAAFLLVFGTLRLIDRLPSSRKVRVAKAEAEEEAPPRLRRWDFHPDAPSRVPLMAGRDLGEPIVSVGPEPVTAPFWQADDFPVEEDTKFEEIDTVEELELSVVEPESIELPEAEPAPVMARPLEPASIQDLMGRLERGLARRTERKAFAQDPVAIAEPLAEPVAEPFEDPVEERLRKAIGNLQQLASRSS